jgi:hypothetical protein
MQERIEISPGMGCKTNKEMIPNPKFRRLVLPLIVK